MHSHADTPSQRTCILAAFDALWALQHVASPTMQVMLGLVTDIKNNKRRPGKGAEAAPAVLPPAVQTWLKTSGVGEVELRNVTWAKLLSSDKRVRLQSFWHLTDGALCHVAMRPGPVKFCSRCVASDTINHDGVPELSPHSLMGL